MRTYLAIIVFLVFVQQAAAPPFVAVQGNPITTEELRVTTLALLYDKVTGLDTRIQNMIESSATSVHINGVWTPETEVIALLQPQLDYWNERIGRLEELGN